VLKKRGNEVRWDISTLVLQQRWEAEAGPPSNSLTNWRAEPNSNEMVKHLSDCHLRDLSRGSTSHDAKNLVLSTHSNCESKVKSYPVVRALSH
jgi:hypothetical protein